jgi:hypothetical protein
MATAGRVIDAALQLLDRQLVDRDGKLCGKVDDLELVIPDDAPTEGHVAAPYVSVILSGPAALAGRTKGLLSRWLLAMQRRLHPDEDPQPARLFFGLVSHLDTDVHLGLGREDVEADRFERWVRDNVIAKIPGADHAAE